MSNINYFERFKCGFRSLHSTETVLYEVTNDILITLDSGESSNLLLLDLSVAFDMVGHNIELN